jgi:DNA-binding NtrC family response regulator
MANILVIDDESILLDLVSTVLRLDGHQVTAMSEPLAALNFVQNGNAVLDLILTDISLKPINGFELAKRFGKLGFECPVIFMSGYSSISGIIVDAMGERSLLDKPFTAVGPSPRGSTCTRQRQSKILSSRLTTIQPSNPS